MQLYELVADTPLAKQRVATGGPNIFLSDETAIGRTASGPGSLPIDWAQVSGNHCRVFLASKDPPVYRLEDKSTNGTAINGIRVPKGDSRPLAEGDRIRLAVATQDPKKLIEYIFRRVPEGSKLANIGKRPLDAAHPTPDAKRAALHDPKTSPQADSAVVQKLRQSNDELRKRMEAERQATVEARSKANELEQQLKASDGSMKEAAELKNRLAEAESALRRNIAECGEAQQEAAQQKVAAERAQKAKKQLAKERDDLAERVEQMEASHRAAQKSLSAAEQSARQDLQRKAEELQRAIQATSAAERRAHDEAVGRSAAEQREQELQRGMWEIKLKLQRAEDACTAAEEKALCLESFVREGLGSVGRARQRNQAEQMLLENLRSTVETLTGVLDELDHESAVVLKETKEAKHTLESALNVCEAEPGREGSSGQAAAPAQPLFQGTQQPTQSAADGSGSTGFKSPSRSIATQPRSSPPQPPFTSPTLGQDPAVLAAPEVAQHMDEDMADARHTGSADAGCTMADSEVTAGGRVAQGDHLADAVQGSSFVLNHIMGAQPRSSVNTPSFGTGCVVQQPIGESSGGFIKAEAELSRHTLQPADVDAQDPADNDERENLPTNGTVNAGIASTLSEKQCNQRNSGAMSAKPALQLSLQGRDRYGVDSHEDEFGEME